MNHTEKLYQLFDGQIRKTICQLQDAENVSALTDLYIMPNPEDAELSILNDDQEVLAKIQVDAWRENDENLNSEAELEISEKILKDIFSHINEEGLLEKINIQKPFSVLMVDDDFESISELLFLDDDTVGLSEDLLKEVDQELNDFFRQLMSDF